MRLYNGLPGPGPCEGCGFTTCRCKDELAERRASARDEVVRAAKEWALLGSSEEEAALDAAVAALAKLEKP